MAAIFDFYRLGKAGKEICTKGVSDDQKKEMSEGGVINISFSPPFPPPPRTVHSSSKSNMADGMNDRELNDVNSL